MAVSKVKEIASSAPVVVFSKTYCGYCKRVKQLFSQLGAKCKVVELDEESDGGEMQMALHEWTGLRTVPNVFIGGKHIGGCELVIVLPADFLMTTPFFDFASQLCGFRLHSRPRVCTTVVGKHQIGELIPLLSEVAAIE